MKGNRSDLLAAALVGAGLVYVLDPDRGARRRGLIRDKAIRAGHKIVDGVGTTARDVENRAKGTVAELRSRLRHEEADDEVLEERVRSAIGRASSHPRAIEVSVEDGRVTLGGAVLEDERSRVLRTARRVRGVHGVTDQLEGHAESEGIPWLQGDRPRTPRPELLQAQWAPAARVMVGALGATLASRARHADGVLDVLSAVAGAALLTRAITNLPMRRLTGIGAGPRAIDVQKVITVHAPAERVWELWSDYEQFPRFMTHLKEVRRTGPDRSHWVAVGPAGTSLEWDAVTTAWVPQMLISWKSVEGSTVENAGRVQFRRLSDQETQIDVRLSYNAPGGAAAHALTAAFRVDPTHAMDEDLLRLKTLLESEREAVR